MIVFVRDYQKKTKTLDLVGFGGEAGASKALGIIQTEMDKTMAYTGCNRVDEISRDIFFEA